MTIDKIIEFQNNPTLKGSFINFLSGIGISEITKIKFLGNIKDNPLNARGNNEVDFAICVNHLIVYCKKYESEISYHEEYKNYLSENEIYPYMLSYDDYCKEFNLDASKIKTTYYFEEYPISTVFNYYNESLKALNLIKSNFNTFTSEMGDSLGVLRKLCK